MSSSKVIINAGHVPMISKRPMRVVIGAVMLLASAVCSGLLYGGGCVALFVIATIAWIPAVLVTDKYVHKYPQRYYSYLASSHLKAALIMAIPLALLAWIVGDGLAPYRAVGALFVLFCIGDFCVSALRRSRRPGTGGGSSAGEEPARQGEAGGDLALLPVSREGVLRRIPAGLESALHRFIEAHLPDEKGGEELLVVQDNLALDSEIPAGAGVNFILCMRRINDIRRINRFLRSCVGRLDMGGYLFISYTPKEFVTERQMQSAGSGLLFRARYLTTFLCHRALPKTPYLNSAYFALTRGRNRMLSKVEVWGRLSYFGFHVLAEERCGDRVLLMARRQAAPSKNPRPSYYPVVALEKVGLDGEIVRLHKVRSMYPFSEFLQKRIFEDNGLASTGKFANDFRLTEYGNFIRRYWIDELPQIWDWLRGDIKLVGMRATSRHYLSLYPQELYDLYIQIKPGLIPPIFDEKTDSFDRIVEVEMAYLTSYMKSPLKTDVGLFFRTFTDIFFRGVRSK